MAENLCHRGRRAKGGSLKPSAARRGSPCRSTGQAWPAGRLKRPSYRKVA